MLIAGAGIIGLTTALELATRWPQPLEITVLERGRAMQEASWAAAGMLAAHDPENPPQLAALAQKSLALYPEFLEQIERLSGCAVPLRTRHTLQICPREHLPDGAKLLSTAEAAERGPGLGRVLPGSLLWLDEHSLDPRDLCRALPLAVQAACVRIVDDCAVDAIDLHPEQVTARTACGPYQADAMIVCCGAWPVTGRSIGIRTPLKPHFSTPSLPRKGQMLSVRMPAGSVQLSTVLRSPEIYLVPRDSRGSRVILGATVEDAGFDRSIQPASTSWLLAKAAAIWPPILDGKIEDIWTGIRPGTPDGLPMIGPLADPPAGSASTETAPTPAIFPRLWFAAGHYRNGILLAPGTAHVLISAFRVSGLDTSGLNEEWSAEPAFDLAPFDPRRFEDTAAPFSVVPMDERDSVIH